MYLSPRVRTTFARAEKIGELGGGKFSSNTGSRAKNTFAPVEVAAKND